MVSSSPFQLGRRERQIMDVIYRRGRATAAEVLAELPDPPSYSSVRGMLRLLEEKGLVTHVQDGPRYVYSPVVDAESASRSALKHLIRTFFQGSAAAAASALLDLTGDRMSESDLDRLADRIEQARQRGD